MKKYVKTDIQYLLTTVVNTCSCINTLSNILDTLSKGNGLNNHDANTYTETVLQLRKNIAGIDLVCSRYAFSNSLNKEKQQAFDMATTKSSVYDAQEHFKLSVEEHLKYLE
ncbi:hypothetical protein KDU71_02410 [Carboxylicivirga sediminis]|uniref:Uncharacterized protein n=1 Tax=Carboxylicivirga sediminis TaxID=2006564 RepID=A0A941F0W3_9BACT|nr:hypothetical protein [Carboxylicivirga sediminis]MBR8534397.1 hypothetical protein [Carboxylicivirga sediminis]